MRPIIILPTYNERENIRDLIRQILDLNIGGLSVIVVDSASPDGTADIVGAIQHDHRQVLLVQQGKKLGLGVAYRVGIATAQEHGADVVGTMDADFSHNPRYLPAMLEAIKSADLVVGSRYVTGGSTKGCPMSRKILSRVANGVARFLLNLRTHDTTAGFRLYRFEALRRIDFDAIHSEGYSYLVEMLFACERAGLRVLEVPICFENRTRGQSKISRKEVWRSIRMIFRLALRRFWKNRPVSSPG
jgi:glycosyltransferase involved in cell wall biosynthesis